MADTTKSTTATADDKPAADAPAADAPAADATAPASAIEGATRAFTDGGGGTLKEFLETIEDDIDHSVVVTKDFMARIVHMGAQLLHFETGQTVNGKMAVELQATGAPVQEVTSGDSAGKA